jgi:hypothetical protein
MHLRTLCSAKGLRMFADKKYDLPCAQRNQHPKIGQSDL